MELKPYVPKLRQVSVLSRRNAVLLDTICVNKVFCLLTSANQMKSGSGTPLVAHFKTTNMLMVDSKETRASLGHALLHDLQFLVNHQPHRSYMRLGATLRCVIKDLLPFVP